MIRNITKNLVSLTRPFAFSSYKVKGNYPIHMKTSYGDQQSKNVSKDAERVF
jgi:hypothetical protein